MTDERRSATDERPTRTRDRPDARRGPAPPGRHARPRLLAQPRGAGRRRRSSSELLHREFPRQASEWLDGRRAAARASCSSMGASLALAGLAGCTAQPPRRSSPTSGSPRRSSPASRSSSPPRCTLGGVRAPACWSRATWAARPRSRATRDHPASLGATDAFAQASVLGLYDPDRSQVVTRAGADQHLERASSPRSRRALAAQQAQRRRGAAHPDRDGHLADAGRARSRRCSQRFPQAALAPVRAGRAATTPRAGATLAFGAAARAASTTSPAPTSILSLDADFLCDGPGAPALRPRLRRAAPAARRRGAAMNRLYVVESTPTVDRRDRRPPAGAARRRRSRRFARALAARAGRAPAPRRGRRAGADRGAPRRWVAAVAADLRAHRGAALVVAGDDAAAARSTRSPTRSTHALGNVGTTVVYTEPVEADAGRPAGARSRELVARHATPARVETLLILGGNPVYDAPADLDFAAALAKVAAAASTSASTTTRPPSCCHWHVPAAHYLETWGDARAYDGTVVDRPAADRAALRRQDARTSCSRSLARPHRRAPRYELVREHWRTRAGARRLRGRLAARAPRRRRRRTPRRRAAAVDARRGAVAAAGGRARRGAAPAPGERSSLFRARPDGLRRPLRQQRLAPGAAASR